MNRWDAIRTFYAKWQGEIFDAGRNQWADDDAYLWDHEGMGWMVYRITGKDCRTQYDENTREPGVALPFVRDIAERHRIIEGSGYLKPMEAKKK
jgi:hypothetical protein